MCSLLRLFISVGSDLRLLFKGCYSYSAVSYNINSPWTFTLYVCMIVYVWMCLCDETSASSLLYITGYWRFVCFLTQNKFLDYLPHGLPCKEFLSYLVELLSWRPCIKMKSLIIYSWPWKSFFHFHCEHICKIFYQRRCDEIHNSKKKNQVFHLCCRNKTHKYLTFFFMKPDYSVPY